MAGLRAEEEAAWGLQGNRHSSSRSDAVVAGSTVRARVLSRSSRSRVHTEMEEGRDTRMSGATNGRATAREQQVSAGDGGQAVH